MIRVLHFGLDSRLGGIETYLHKLYTNIDRRKFHFDFLVIGNEEPCWYNEFTEMGSKFYAVTPRSKNPFKNKREIEKIFKQEKFDIIHCHLNTLSYIEPVLRGIKADIPVIVHSRNGGTSQSKISNILHRINSYILPKDKIVKLAVSDLAGKWLFGNYCEYEVINNGLDVNKYKFNEESRSKIRKELELNDELVIIHLGAMRKQKNHMFLLEVFKEIVKIKKNSKLLLVGEGDLHNDIVIKINSLGIKENVILTGNRSDVSEVLCAGDIFLFPSLFEGFPNAVLEAQATGLPCLISDVITQEVMINKNCKSMSLNSSKKEWAELLLSLQSFNKRESSYKNIKKHGFDVYDEIKRIENIYEMTTKKNEVRSL